MSPALGRCSNRSWGLLKAISEQRREIITSSKQEVLMVAAGWAKSVEKTRNSSDTLRTAVYQGQNEAVFIGWRIAQLHGRAEGRCCNPECRSSNQLPFVILWAQCLCPAVAGFCLLPWNSESVLSARPVLFSRLGGHEGFLARQLTLGLLQLQWLRESRRGDSHA
jgi:hypothetical protein